MTRLLCLLAFAASLASGQALAPGSAVPDFQVRDLAGKPHSFETLKGETTVVLFVATGCPVSNRYNTRMVELYNEWAPRGVRFLFVNSNMTEPAAEVAEHSRANGFPFAVYKDDGNIVADLFGAQFTPETFIVDAGGIVRYHGRIDDSQHIDRMRERTLSLAIAAIRSGQAPAQPDTKAFGCTIRRVKRDS
ncbi:MAG: redoxin domain-containing protein [Bryobacterales bacterium]|nr:redoxin domain-containing protein [Bryobacterales bacterium]